MHDSLVTTTRGLQRAAPAMRLYEKAKRLGIWNPGDIDLSQDARDWQTMKPDEQDSILRLTALFQAGVEETINGLLQPVIGVIADIFATYPDGRFPFGLQLDEFVDYAMNQFQKRMDRIERARGATLDEVERVTRRVIDEGDA